MKQGQSTSRSGDQKREPIVRQVDPGAVSRIGVIENATTGNAIYSGRGFQAPAPVAETSHPCGSQGKHK